MSGAPSFDLGLGDIHAPQSTLDEIFNYIDEADKPCIIAIDEFQQISEYPEKNVEALLRTQIQRCKKAQFVFSGSKRHLMNNMFNSPSKPFYQSVISMGLDPIPMDEYAKFALRMFEQRGKGLDVDVVNVVWRQFDGYTWYVQMVMNELFSMTENGSRCDKTMIADAYTNIIHVQEGSYKNILSQLAPRQKVVLQAIAKEGNACNITSAKFIGKYNLGTASSVQAAVKSLVNNDLITVENGIYRVSDYFFSTWLAKDY